MSTININLWLAAHRQGGSPSIGLRGRLNMAGDNYLAGNQNVGTAAEAIQVGDVTGADALVVLRNTDADNFVTLYADGETAAYPFGILYPGQFCALISHATPILALKADTAACVVEKLILEDVEFAAGALATYRPSMPVLGYATAGLSISTVIDGQTITLAHQHTEAIDGSGLVDAVSATDLGGSLWPVTNGPVQGNRFGTIMAVNLNAATYYSTLRADSGGQPFGLLPMHFGFALLPLNSATGPYYIANAAHQESRLVTRKTIS